MQFAACERFAVDLLDEVAEELDRRVHHVDDAEVADQEPQQGWLLRQLAQRRAEASPAGDQCRAQRLCDDAAPGATFRLQLPVPAQPRPLGPDLEATAIGDDA